jgi:hypothetical protein
MLRTFFTVIRVDCKRKTENTLPITSVTFRFGKEGDWRADRGWYSVSDVNVDYPGTPLHSVGDEAVDINCHMQKLLDLDGDLIAKRPTITP